MPPASNRLEKLKGDRAGQHSIRINDQWRICFRWKDGNAYAPAEQSDGGRPRGLGGQILRGAND